ncbi:hypothetical protein G9A89_017873 [Geosiphon pyriformis]|nr:hypothetical protein G9A89_017873 [Geosiphon pyriformis]
MLRQRIKKSSIKILNEPMNFDEKAEIYNTEMELWKTQVEEMVLLRENERKSYQETFIMNNELKEEISRLNQWVVHLNSANNQAADDLTKNLETILSLKEEWEEATKNFCDEKSHYKLLKENESLKAHIKKLEEEIRTYKSRRPFICDQNTVESKHDFSQLQCDLEGLNDSLRNTTSLKNPDFRIHEEAAKRLLDKYDVKYYPGEPLPRNLVSAAMQRHIIETVLQRMNAHFDQSDKLDRSAKPIVWRSLVGKMEDPKKEISKESMHDQQIIAMMGSMAEHLSSFAESNPAAHSIAEKSRIQLRQLIFNLLASRTLENSSSETVDSICREILANLNEIRSITDIQQKQLLAQQDRATIRQCISTIFFKLASQYPPLHIEWLQKRLPVDPSIMDITSIEDDESIEICSFPLIKVTETGDIVFKAHVETSSEGTKCGDDLSHIEQYSDVVVDATHTENTSNTFIEPKKDTKEISKTEKDLETEVVKTPAPKICFKIARKLERKNSKLVKNDDKLIPFNTPVLKKAQNPTHKYVKRSNTAPPMQQQQPRLQKSYINGLASWATTYVPPSVQTWATSHVPPSIQSKFGEYIPYYI